VKTTVSAIKIFLAIILIGGFLVLGFPTLKNKLFYKSGLVSRDIFTLSNKINSISPEDISPRRTDLLKEIDNFAKDSVSGTRFSSNIYSLIKIRLDQALKEIPQTKIPQGKVKIWYLYNMGIVAKSDNKTIAFDLASTDIYSNLADFTKYIDILFISHPHGDHLDLSVVKQALKNGVTVIIPGDKVIFDETGQLIKDPQGEDLVSFIKRRNNIDSENLISLKPQEKIIIRGVEITAYPSNHTYIPTSNEDPDSIAPFPLDWYYVNLSGVSILHMGDGTDKFNYQPDFTNQIIDVFITHNTDSKTNDSLIKLVPQAKTILPLHVWELNHGSGIINYMNYQTTLDDYSKGYYKNPSGKIKFIPLIWGESLLF